MKKKPINIDNLDQLRVVIADRAEHLQWSTNNLAKAAAEEGGVSRTTVYKFMAGTLPVVRLVDVLAIAKAVGVKLAVIEP